MNNCTLESSTGSDANWVFLYYNHLLFVLEEPGHHITDQLDSKQTLVTLILHFQKEGSHNLSSLCLFYCSVIEYIVFFFIFRTLFFEFRLSNLPTSSGSSIIVFNLCIIFVLKRYDHLTL